MFLIFYREKLRKVTHNYQLVLFFGIDVFCDSEISTYTGIPRLVRMKRSEKSAH